MQLRQITIAFVLSVLAHTTVLFYFNVKLPSPYKQPSPIEVVFATPKSSPPKQIINPPKAQRVLAIPSEIKPEIPVQPELPPVEKVSVTAVVPEIPDVPTNLNIPENFPPNNLPPTQKIESISNLTRIPSPLNKIEAAYPASERRAGKQSYVLAEIIINTRGEVQEVNILKSGGSVFDTAVINSLKKTVFTPGYIGEKVVPVRISIPFRFKLN
jgi:TonB family protein